MGEPWGTGPNPGDPFELGSMLRADAAERGANFLFPGVRELFGEVSARWAEERRFRGARNLLSSQTMCFNVFGPLMVRPEWATPAFRALFPGEIEAVSEVLLEYEPQPREDYLLDRTAFDAFVGYRRADDSKGFLGIEVKLAEGFSDTPYDKARYEAFTQAPDSAWRPEAWPSLMQPRYNQLWRDHLLCEAVRRHPVQRHGSRGRLVLLRHPEDAEAGKVASEYRTYLRFPDESFTELCLDDVVGTWRLALPDEAEPWLDALSLRYLDLHRSGQFQ